MKKKLTSLILGMGMILSSIAFSFAANQVALSDIGSHWAKDTILNLYGKGIIGGYPDNTYRPQNAVTTAEFLKLALETSGIKGDYTGSPWHQQLMNTAFESGIINDTIYNQPDGPIQRKDVAAVLAALIEKNTDLRSEFITGESLDYIGYSKVVSDTHGLPEGVQHSIYKLFEYGLITGSTNSGGKVIYQPESDLTRAEIAVILERLIDPGKRVKVEKPEPYQVTFAPESFLSDYNRAVDYTSLTYYDIDFENERLLFRVWERDEVTDPENYYYHDGIKVSDTLSYHVLEENFNPRLNKQVYDLMRVLVGEEKYVFIFNSHGHEDDRDRVVFHYSHNVNNAHAGINYFSIVFSETEGFNNKANYHNAHQGFSENAAITLNLVKLFDRYSQDGWLKPFYAKKLKDSMVVLFGEDTGIKIFDYIINQYMTRQESQIREEEYKVKVIDNIQIDLYIAPGGVGHYAFTYLK